MSELTPRDLKKQRRWVKTFLTISIVLGLFGLIHKAHVYFDPTAARVYGRLIHVRIGGRDFGVPSDYIRGPLPHGEARQLYLWLTLPNYQPYQGDYIEGKNPVPIGYRHVTVLIDDAQFDTDLAFRYGATRNGPEAIFRPEDTSDVYGLHRTLVWKSNARSPQSFIVHDLYYTLGPNNNVTAFVSCRRDEPAPRNPMCSHFFQDGRLVYQVDYSKTNLAQWSEIERRVQALLNKFACVPTVRDNISNKNNKGESLCPP